VKNARVEIVPIMDRKIAVAAIAVEITATNSEIALIPRP